MALFQLSRKYKPYYQRNTFGRRLWFVVKLLLGWFFLYEFITVFFVSSYSVDSVSMQPSLSKGDRILVSRLQYGPFLPLSEKRLPGIGDPKRGDIVLLTPPYYRDALFAEKTLNPFVRFFSFNRRSLSFRYREPWEQPLIVKRIIGTPGDTIRMKNGVVYIKPDGSGQFMMEYELARTAPETTGAAADPGWDKTVAFPGSLEDFMLRSGEYYVLGDNRNESSDSRFWGPVKREDIRGKVVFRYFPFGAIGAP